MFKKLYPALNLYVFSFLSSSDIQRNKAINKTTQNFSGELLVWRNILKNEFFLPEAKEVKEPQLEYQALKKDLSIERKKLSQYLMVVLLSREIKNQILAGKIEDIRDYPIPKEYQDDVYEQDHQNRIRTFDGQIAQSENSLIQEFYRLKNCIYFTEEKEIQDIGEKYRVRQKKVNLMEETLKLEIEKNINDVFQLPSENSTSFVSEMLFALVKLNFTITMRIALNKFKLNQSLLDRLLHEACRSCNISMAQLLIESGANVNAILFHKKENGAIQSTSLFQVLISNFHSPFPQKVMQFIEFLLKNGADPDAECFTLLENQEYPRKKNITIEEYDKGKISLREKCKIIKALCNDPSDRNILQLMDLLISAPKITPEETGAKKMRIG